MGINTGISWTDHTWNVARGCTKVDEDCRFCYMYRESWNGTRYNPREIVKTKTVFDLPLKTKDPARFFTSSLTDLFHEAIDPYRNEVWDIIRKCPQHTFQILTKRPERIAAHLPPDWNTGFDNVWIGTSIGSNKGMKRMFALMDAFHEFKNGGLDLRKPVTFISFEPLYERLEINNLDLSTYMWFDWVIVGGESGNETGPYRYRPCEVEWMDEIVHEFSSCGVAVFVKQMGTHLAKQLGMSDRHGGNFDEFPANLKMREFPSPKKSELWK